jgi:ribosomal protein S18 acetylase RimI-like enzyme
VPHSTVITRRATVADVPALVSLWTELRDMGARAERAVNPISTPDIAVRLAEVIAGERTHVVLACRSGEPAGMAVCRVVHPDPLSDSRVLQVSHVVVARQHRRRGVGHALLAAAVEIADAEQLEHVGVEVYPSVREASRFYARLGFAPVTVQRVAPLSVLRRRLGGERASARAEDLVRRRTRVRRPLPAQRESRRTTGIVD